MEKACAAHDTGDDERALHFAEKVARLSAGHSKAIQLIEHIKQWGNGSEAAAAVKEALEADFYSVLGIDRCIVLDEATVRKAYLKKSKQLHPVCWTPEVLIVDAHVLVGRFQAGPITLP